MQGRAAGTGMTAEAIRGLFAGPDGGFRFARWGRQVAPVIFGTDDATLATLHAALAQVAALGGRSLAGSDPETGANLMIFFLRDWSEIAAIPDFGRMVGEGAPDAAGLAAAGAQRYRRFRFDASGAIRAAFALVLLEGERDGIAAEVLALEEAVRLTLAWGPQAFAEHGAVEVRGGQAVIRPEIAALIRAAHDPVLPAASGDPALALRLAARIAAAG